MRKSNNLICILFLFCFYHNIKTTAALAAAAAAGELIQLIEHRQS